jgi:pimeloyl-[acyl-carrier protein] methyl ester esterase
MKTSLYFKHIGQGPALVLLHGWGWSSEIWEPLIPQLSQRFQLILIDLPGFGKSPLNISHYTFEAIAPLLFECVPEQAIWLGWSLGGMLAWWLAITYPEKISKLITVAASPRFVSDAEWPGVSAITLLGFAESLKNNYEKTLTDFLELQLRGSANYKILLEKLQQQVKTTPPEMKALEGGLKLLQTVDLRNEMQKVKCDSLHIFGERDRLVPVEVAEVLTPGKSEIISKSGHLPFLSQTESFLNSIFTFTKD